MTNDEELHKRIQKAVFPGLQGGPHDHVTAAKAVAFKEALSPQFKRYAKQVVANAKAMANEFANRGYRVVTGGTDNHLMLLDVTSIGVSGLTGKIAQNTLEYIGVSVNKNSIPFDKRKPWDPSGIRIGTPAITTRGFKESDVLQVVEIIDTALRNYSNIQVLDTLRKKVRQLASEFPLFADEWLPVDHS